MPEILALTSDQQRELAESAEDLCDYLKYESWFGMTDREVELVSRLRAALDAVKGKNNAAS